MTEMIERVARAICRNHDLDPDWGNPPAWQNDWCIADAKSALQSLREPTQEMLEVGEASPYTNHALRLWRQMIDAALGVQHY